MLRYFAQTMRDPATAAAPDIARRNLRRHRTRGNDAAAFWQSRSGLVDLDALAARPERAAELRAAAQELAATRRLRRVRDILIAAVLLVLLAPLMLLIALIIRLDSRGPVIYRQERVGLGGRHFVMLKFRSMRADAEADGVAVWARINDARITRVGRFIRKVRIDELPQLFNVIRGDMSLVGPRPERPVLSRALHCEIPFFELRTLVKPGLTGWAQIKYAYAASAAEARGKLAYDLYYVKNRSLRLDLMIIAATIRVLLFQTGAR